MQLNCLKNKYKITMSSLCNRDLSLLLQNCYKYWKKLH